MCLRLPYAQRSEMDKKVVIFFEKKNIGIIWKNVKLTKYPIHNRQEDFIVTKIN
jgi:hypothetical protein